MYETDYRWRSTTDLNTLLKLSFLNSQLIPLGEDFESNVRGSVASFVIKQVYPEDEGQYSCIVTNNLGTATSTACLIVNGESFA